MRNEGQKNREASKHSLLSDKYSLTNINTSKERARHTHTIVGSFNVFGDLFITPQWGILAILRLLDMLYSDFGLAILLKSSPTAHYKSLTNNASPFLNLPLAGSVLYSPFFL